MKVVSRGRAFVMSPDESLAVLAAALGIGWRMRTTGDQEIDSPESWDSHAFAQIICLPPLSWVTPEMTNVVPPELQRYFIMGTSFAPSFIRDDCLVGGDIGFKGPTEWELALWRPFLKLVTSTVRMKAGLFEFIDPETQERWPFKDGWISDDANQLVESGSRTAAPSDSSKILCGPPLERGDGAGR